MAKQRFRPIKSILEYFMQTKGLEQVKQEIVDTPPTPYHAFMLGDISECIEKLPPFTLYYASVMRRDTTIQFGMAVRAAALSAGEIKVESKSPEVKAWVESSWKKLWGKYGRYFRATSVYGFAGFRVDWKYDGDKIVPDGVQEFAPFDTRCLIWRGKPCGFRMSASSGYSMVSMEKKVGDFGFPQGLWMSFGKKWGNNYGRSILKNSYGPWWEKWMQGGTKETIQLRMMKDAYRGDIFWYPPEKIKMPNGTEVHCRDVFREVIENTHTGSALCLPKWYDANGNEKTSYTPPQDFGRPEGIFEWAKRTDVEMLWGLSVPMEIIQAAETGSGFSGRSIPLAVFLSSMSDEFEEYIECIDTCCLHPAAMLNFGPDVDYTIEAVPLVDSFAAQLSGSNMGGTSFGGGMDGPPERQGRFGQQGQPGQQQPPSGLPVQFAADFDESKHPRESDGKFAEKGEGKAEQFEADERSGRWITIGGRKSEDGEHAGGFPVYIDADGVILKGGPKGLHGKHVSESGKHLKQLREDHKSEKQREFAERSPIGRSKSFAAIAAYQAEKWGIEPDEYEAIAKDVMDEETSRLRERESAKTYARERLKLDAGKIARMENAGKDYAHNSLKGLDTVGREMASMYPGLGWGAGYEQGVSEDKAPDYDSLVWELVKEGKQAVPSRISAEFHEQVEDYLEHAFSRAGSGYKAPEPEFDYAQFDTESPGQKKKNAPAQFALNDGLSADESDDLVAEAVRLALERIQATKDDILATITGGINSPAEMLTKVAAKLEPARRNVQEELEKLLVSADLRGAAEVAGVFGSTRFGHLAASATPQPPGGIVSKAPTAPPEAPVAGLGKTAVEDLPRLRLPVVDDAIEVLKNSPVSAGRNYMETAEKVREGAFSITGDLADNTIEGLRGLIEDQLREGWNRDDFREKARAVLEEGRGILSDAHLNLVFRQNTNKYVSDAKERTLRDPIVVSAFPYRRRIVTIDPRVRPEHRKLATSGLNGTAIYNADDPVWQAFRSPFDFGCRCVDAPVTVKQASDAGVSEAREWWDRAVALASENGDNYPERYLGETMPERFEFVEWPTLDGEKFYPPPEFQNMAQFSFDESQVNRGETTEGTNAGSFAPKGENEGHKFSTEVLELAKMAKQKGWSKKVKQAKIPAELYDDVQSAIRILEQKENPSGVNLKMTDKEKTDQMNVREEARQKRETADRLAAESAAKSMERIKAELPEKESLSVEMLGMMNELTPRQIERYTNAAISWQSHNPQKSAIDFTVTKLKKLGVKLTQQGENYSWYGQTNDGRSVRVGNHLGFESHDIEFVYDISSGFTRGDVAGYVQSELQNSGLSAE